MKLKDSSAELGELDEAQAAELGVPAHPTKSKVGLKGMPGAGCVGV
jgi:hypothetical protein